MKILTIYLRILIGVGISIYGVLSLYLDQIALAQRFPTLFQASALLPLISQIDGGILYFFPLLLAVLGMGIAIGYPYFLSARLSFFILLFFLFRNQFAYTDVLFLLTSLSFIASVCPLHLNMSAVTAWKKTDIYSTEAVLMTRGLVFISLLFRSIGQIEMQFTVLNTPLFHMSYLLPVLTIIFVYGLIVWRRVAIYSLFLLQFMILIHISYRLQAIPLYFYFLTALLVLWADDALIHRVRQFVKMKLSLSNVEPHYSSSSKKHRVIGVVFTLLLLSQVLIPLRQFMGGSYIAWSKNGHLFAWRMRAYASNVLGTMTVQDGQSGKPEDVVLTDYFYDIVINILDYPYIQMSVAKHIADIYQKKGVEDPIVKSNILVGINGEPYSRLIDPETVLNKEKFTLIKENKWVTDWPYKR